MKIFLTCCFLTIRSAFDALAQEKPFIEVPFEFYRNEIIVQVKVDGKGPFNMMLDTGTDPTAVDLAIASIGSSGSQL